jgi:hypothetical protein
VRFRLEQVKFILIYNISPSCIWRSYEYPVNGPNALSLLALINEKTPRLYQPQHSRTLPSITSPSSYTSLRWVIILRYLRVHPSYLHGLSRFSSTTCTILSRVWIGNRIYSTRTPNYNEVSHNYNWLSQLSLLWTLSRLLTLLSLLPEPRTSCRPTSQSPNCRLRLLCPWSPSQGPEPLFSEDWTSKQAVAYCWHSPAWLFLM